VHAASQSKQTTIGPSFVGPDIQLRDFSNRIEIAS
jgi:hypothetical protein